MGTRLLSLWVLQNSEGQGVSGWRHGAGPGSGWAEEIQRPCTLPFLRPQQLALEDLGQSQMVASAPENSAKNRYRNVLPCESRASAVLARVGGQERQHPTRGNTLVPCSPREIKPLPP